MLSFAFSILYKHIILLSGSGINSIISAITIAVTNIIGIVIDKIFIFLFL